MEGRIRSHTWSVQDGQNRFRNEIIADRVLFLDRANATGQGSESEMGISGDPEDIEDLPF